jgi:tetratricopeptide (TPR) repeat protein
MRTLCAASVVLLTCCPEGVRAVAPPARLGAEQQRQLKLQETLVGPANKAIDHGKFTEAVRLVRRILEIERAVFGEVRSGDEGVSWPDGLAYLHERREELGKAVSVRQELMRLRKRWHGPGDWRTRDARLDLEDCSGLARLEAVSRRRLGQADEWNARVVRLWRQGRSTEALPLAKEALAVRREVLGDKHRQTAMSWFNLAARYKALYRFADAERCKRQVLAIRKKIPGEKHPDYAQSLNGLASLYRDMGEHRQALPLFRQVLLLRKGALGENHLDYVHNLNNLAALYQALGDYRQALRLFQQALKLLRAGGREKHPDCARGPANLGRLYQDMGEHKRALPLLEQALAIREATLGEKHPTSAANLSALAVLHWGMGDYTKALPLLKQVREFDKATLGEKHPHYAGSLNNLALLYTEMGDYARALPLSYTNPRTLSRLLAPLAGTDTDGCDTHRGYVYQSKRSTCPGRRRGRSIPPTL